MYAVGRCLAGEVAIGIGEVGKYIDVICFFVLAELDDLLILADNIAAVVVAGSGFCRSYGKNGVYVYLCVGQYLANMVDKL